MSGTEYWPYHDAVAAGLLMLSVTPMAAYTIKHCNTMTCLDKGVIAQYLVVISARMKETDGGIMAVDAWFACYTCHKQMRLDAVSVK